MTWIKRGLVYEVSQLNEWAQSHTHKPSALLVNEQCLRNYFGVRDGRNVTRTTFVEVNPENPREIRYVHDRPVLDVGKLGAFDDVGANVSCLVRHDGSVYMYFIGWNPGSTVSTRNVIGLARSEDGGLTFERMFDGPVLGRIAEEPYYNGAVDVMVENEVWKAWYTCGTRFDVINGKPEVSYHIKYAESRDGVHWDRPGIDCIVPRHPLEVTARPSVIRDRGKYRMWYSYRNMTAFRDESEAGYRIGYAESSDGRKWQRRDELVGIDVSGEGWDSQTIAYPAVYRHRGRLFMLYNGNGFGSTGFGYAVEE